eukprot:5619663-Amphidinium_carterae.1
MTLTVVDVDDADGGREDLRKVGLLGCGAFGAVTLYEHKVIREVKHLPKVTCQNCQAPHDYSEFCHSLLLQYQYACCKFKCMPGAKKNVKQERLDSVPLLACHSLRLILGDPTT